MTTLQIVLLSIAGGFALLSIIFMILFIVEISVESKEEVEETEVKSVFSSEEVNKEEQQESVDDMLAKLDEQSNVTVNVIVEAPEAKEEPAEEEAVVEEVSEETTEEVVEETAENAEETTEEAVEVEPLTAANVLDYKARLEKVIENKEQINKDLIKIEKSILNYERTKRRKIRNQKLLDRRASELTNLNLVMYSVTDIKNVDEDKKAKQEELTSHITELKASIQDADEFLESNKEKNEHDVKMAKFLIQEKTRYTEEIAELEKLIAKTEGSTVAD